MFLLSWSFGAWSWRDTVLWSHFPLSPVLDVPSEHPERRVSSGPLGFWVLGLHMLGDGVLKFHPLHGTSPWLVMFMFVNQSYELC